MINLSDINEIENIVIGSILMDRNTIDIAFTNLIPDDFAYHENNILFNSFLRLYSDSKPIDIVTTIEDLKINKEPDCLTHIFHCTNIVGSTANFEYHVTILKNRAIKRNLGLLGQKLISDSTKDNLQGVDIVLEISQIASDLLNRIQFKKILSFKEMVIQTIDESLMHDEKTTIGIKTGFSKMDSILGGLCAPDLILIAAGPGEGKSTFALNIAKNMSLNGNDVLYFSFEMKEKQLIWKLLSDELNTSVMDVRLGRFNSSHGLKTALTRAKMNIYDKGGISIDEICSIIKTEKKQKDIKIVFIDYLQLINLGSYHRKISNRNDEVTIISNKLKQLALTLDIPIVALSQLNRDKTRKRYMMSDLRDSGSLEQDADTIIFIFRPTEHNMDSYALGDQVIQCDEKSAIINIDKCRLGQTGEFEMVFNGYCSRFEDAGNVPEYSNIIEMPKANLNEEMPF